MVKMGTVWDRTAEFLTDNLTAILPIALLAYFVPFSIMRSLAPILYETPGAIMVLWGIVFALVVLVNWGGLALTAMALEQEGEPGAVAVRRLAPSLLVSILLFCGAILLALPAILTLDIGNGIEGLTLSFPVSVQIALPLYCVLAIGLAVWLAARLMLVNPLIVAERRWLSAILRSWSLTRGTALSIVGVTVLYTVVAIVGMLATQLVFGSIFRLVAGPAEGLSLSNILTSVMIAAVQAGFTLVVPVFTAKLYQALLAARAERA
ncbi:MAG: hypothetical protein ACAH11_06035 [Sphingomonas sp.]